MKYNGFKVYIVVFILNFLILEKKSNYNINFFISISKICKLYKWYTIYIYLFNNLNSIDNRVIGNRDIE